MEQALLSSEGRIRRKTYWMRWLVAVGLHTLLRVIAETAKSGPLVAISVVFSVVVAIFVIFQGIKRMHDVNKSGWHIFIPIYNIIQFCTDGTPGRNRFGDDPKGRAS